jgi:hypothetical protein
MAAVTIATTAPHGVILQLQNPVSFYTPQPAYGTVTILPPSQGGGATYQKGPTLIQSPTIDGNFWSAWAAENAQNPLLVNDVIFST